MAAKKLPLRPGEKVLDYRGQELAVGDTIVYATSSSNNVCMNEGRIVNIYKVDPYAYEDEPNEEKAEPRLTVEVVGEEDVWGVDEDGRREYKGTKPVPKNITIQVIRRVVKVPPLAYLKKRRY